MLAWGMCLVGLEGSVERKGAVNRRRFFLCADPWAFAWELVNLLFVFPLMNVYGGCGAMDGSCFSHECLLKIN